MLDATTSVLSQACYEGLVFGLVTIGVYLTFRVLSFPDLSVEGTFPLGGATAAVLIVNGVNPFLATLAALGAGLCAGLLTGLLNTRLRITALLAGILVAVALYSINLRIMGGANTPLLREVTIFDKVGEFLGLGSGTTLSIVVALVVVIIIYLFLYWFLRTEIGLMLRATGDNEQMVRSLGGDTNKAVLLGCSISNGLVALAGALVAQNQGFSDVGMGIGMIVIGLAALIIGEALFRFRGIAWVLIACLGGAFVYRLFLIIALRLGMHPGDLKMITAILVVLVLGVPIIMKKIRGEWLPPAARW
jgi:putative ABC transport system permease protein